MAFRRSVYARPAVKVYPHMDHYRSPSRARVLVHSVRNILASVCHFRLSTKTGAIPEIVVTEPPPCPFVLELTIPSPTQVSPEEVAHLASLFGIDTAARLAFTSEQLFEAGVAAKVAFLLQEKKAEFAFRNRPFDLAAETAATEAVARRCDEAGMSLQKLQEFCDAFKQLSDET